MTTLATTISLTDFLGLKLPVAHKAYELAKEIHKNDTRDNPNKSPYIQHIEAVILGAYTKFQENPQLAEGLHHEKALDHYLAAAALHDSIEDHPDTITREYLYDQLVDVSEDDPYFLLRTLDVIENLTKKGRKVEHYDEYVHRVTSDMWSVGIKLADLEHNMLDAPHGSRLDKYQLTHKWLTDEFEFELPTSFIQVDSFSADPMGN